MVAAFPEPKWPCIWAAYGEKFRSVMVNDDNHPNSESGGESLERRHPVSRRFFRRNQAHRSEHVSHRDRYLDAPHGKCHICAT